MTFVLIILFLSIICGVVYKYSSQIIEREVIEINTSSVYRTRDVLDRTIKEARQFAGHISSATEKFN